MSGEFDRIIDRRNTNCAKWDEMDEKYGGTDLIHLGVADMDFQAPPPLRKAFADVVEHGIFGYTNPGTEFYSSIQRWLKKQTGEDIPKEWIVYCPRINIAGSLLVDVLTQKNQSVMIHAPYYMPLYDAVKKNKRGIIESPLKWDSGRYGIDFEQMEEAVDNSTGMLILCSPHNPCTTVFTAKELERLADFCIRHDLILVSDEIHSDIRKEGVHFTSALNFCGRLKERLVYVNSPTKTFNIPGMILSYMVIPDEILRNKVKGEIDRIGMHNPNVFANAAVRTGYTECDGWLEDLNRYVDNNEAFVRNYQKKYLPEFDIMPREGTFLLWIDCRRLGMSDEELEQWFIKEARVGVYMGNIFGPEGRGFVRMNIAAPVSVLEEALMRMKKAYEKLQ